MPKAAEPHRKLVAIFSADAVGYARLMQSDEAGTIETLSAYRAAMRGIIAHHNGRVVNAPGDALLAEFPSVLGAVAAAIEIQQALGSHNAERAPERRMPFRIGVHLGDVIEQDDGSIYGDGVNIASRIEALADGGAVCVSSTVFEAVEGKLDLAFDFLGEQQVKNIAKPVRVYRVRSDPGSRGHRAMPSYLRAWLWRAVTGFALLAVVVHVGWRLFGPAPEDPLLTLPRGPSVAVIPFSNLSGHAADEYFADGITEDIITRLSRFQDLKVIARNSTMRYKGRPADARQIGRDLGVRFVVEGSLRRAGDTIRVTAQLIDAVDGSHVWSASYDRGVSVDSLFAVQDDITARIVANIADGYGAISRTLAKESSARPPKDWSAYQCTLFYYQYVMEISLELLRRTIDCAEKAVRADPSYAGGWALLAELYTDDYGERFDTVPDAARRALLAGQRAVMADPASQQAHFGLAWAHFFRRERQQFLKEAETALALNPNRAYLVGRIGWALAYAGEWERGLALIDKAMALNPHHPRWYWYPVWMDHYRHGRYEQALAAANQIRMPGRSEYPMIRAATLGQMGRAAEAQVALAQALAIEPDLRIRPRRYMPSFWVFQPELIEEIVEGLRKAGLEIPPDEQGA